ncbi:hypothetical protein RBE51_18140 [Pseudomonas taiwanensis]|uniref:hypothetical protein n=1 Tax=Pseudomonas taiwanensis TaxID=470150 RepID=UPI0028E09DC9|nr:hypothetical protein [Pseudomonas taiwanensis]MDT8924716.1 hypothetical protein [Pseudomonas taiwanensis]
MAVVDLRTLRVHLAAGDWVRAEALLNAPRKLTLSNGVRSLHRDIGRCYLALFNAAAAHGYLLGVAPYTFSPSDIRITKIMLSALSKFLAFHDLGGKGHMGCTTEVVARVVSHVANCLVAGGHSPKAASDLMISAGMRKQAILSIPVLEAVAEDQLAADLGL